MPTNSKERLRKAFAEVKGRDRRGNRYNAIDPTYKDRYYQEMEDNRKLKQSGDAFTKKRQARVLGMNRNNYIAENGIDRSDLDLFVHDQDEFNRRVNATIGRNMAQRVKSKKKK